MKHLTISFLFTDEELDDINKAAYEHGENPMQLIRTAVLEKIAA